MTQQLLDLGSILNFDIHQTDACIRFLNFGGVDSMYDYDVENDIFSLWITIDHKNYVLVDLQENASKSRYREIMYCHGYLLNYKI